MRFPDYEHGAERTLDVRFITGRVVRVWVEAQTWDEARVRTLGHMLGSNNEYQRMPADELLDALMAHEGMNAVQVTEEVVGGFRVGVMAYGVPFDKSSTRRD